MPVLKTNDVPRAEIDWAGVSQRFLNPGELEVIAGLIESVEPKIVVEFGVNEGRTPQVLLARNPGIERYIGVDVPMGYVTAKEVQRREVPHDPGHLAAHDERFELLLRPRGTLDLTAADFPEVDAVFIDGDHGWNAVLHDSALALQIVRPGGIILWHDYHDLGTVDVREVLNSLSAMPGRNIQHVEGTWVCFERRPISAADAMDRAMKRRKAPLTDGAPTA